MNFTRKGDLYIPDEEPIAKGRSMVGYSRRSFFGLIAAFAIAPKPAHVVVAEITEFNPKVHLLQGKLYINGREAGTVSDFEVKFEEIIRQRNQRFLRKSAKTQTIGALALDLLVNAHFG